METITIYVAKDGTRFDEKTNCEYYESIIDNVDRIMSRLRDNTDVSSVLAIKQDVSEVKSALEDFMRICGEVIPSYRHLFLQVGCGERHISHAGRILSDYSSSYPMLYDTFFRFECINEKSGIEYEQPYYALHEEEFKGQII